MQPSVLNRRQFSLGIGATALAGFGVARAQSEGRIVLGQSAAFSGPAAQLGIQFNQGAKLFFDQLNAAGGVGKRMVEIRTLDDGYEPDRCAENTRKLIADEVFALFGYIGTPTSLAALPLATAARVPFIAPFSGAEALRTPFNRYIVNVRASYAQEMEEWVSYLTTVHGASRIGILYQDDAFGQAGLNALKLALDKRNLAPVSQGTFERNTIAVRQAALDIQAGNPDAIVTIAPYHPTAEFIRMMNALGVKAPIVSISFVGSEALAKDIGLAGTGVYVTQVVPLPTNTTGACDLGAPW